MREVILTKEKVATYVKISRDALKIGMEGNDFAVDLLTAQLVGHVFSAAKEHGDLEKCIEIERPTFLDWLLRRKKLKLVTIPYEISHLVEVKDLPENTLAIIRKLY